MWKLRFYSSFAIHKTIFTCICSGTGRRTVSTWGTRGSLHHHTHIFFFFKDLQDMQTFSLQLSITELFQDQLSPTRPYSRPRSVVAWTAAGFSCTATERKEHKSMKLHKSWNRVATREHHRSNRTAVLQARARKRRGADLIHYRNMQMHTAACEQGIIVEYSYSLAMETHQVEYCLFRNEGNTRICVNITTED